MQFYLSRFHHVTVARNLQQFTVRNNSIEQNLIQLGMDKLKIYHPEWYGELLDFAAGYGIDSLTQPLDFAQLLTQLDHQPKAGRIELDAQSMPFLNLHPADLFTAFQSIIGSLKEPHYRFKPALYFLLRVFKKAWLCQKLDTDYAQIQSQHSAKSLLNPANIIDLMACAYWMMRERTADPEHPEELSSISRIFYMTHAKLWNYIPAHIGYTPDNRSILSRPEAKGHLKGFHANLENRLRLFVGQQSCFFGFQNLLPTQLMGFYCMALFDGLNLPVPDHMPAYIEDSIHSHKTHFLSAEQTYHFLLKLICLHEACREINAEATELFLEPILNEANLNYLESFNIKAYLLRENFVSTGASPSEENPELHPERNQTIRLPT